MQWTKKKLSELNETNKRNKIFANKDSRRLRNHYPDSLTITNAGGFPVGVDINNILTINSVPRCKLMSEVLQKTGLVERSGQGVDKMFYHSIMEGKALPDFSGTDPYQVSLTFKAPIIDFDFVKFIRNEQKSRNGNDWLNVFELLMLYKICMRDFTGLDNAIIEKLQKEGLLVMDKGSYRLSGKYASTLSEILRGFNLKHLQMVSECFKTDTYINRAMLKDVFSDILSEKQIRNLIEKMVKADFIISSGGGKYVQYSKAIKFLSFKSGPQD